MTDKIRITYTSWDERRHLFPQADGREQQCAGPGLCRECNREAVRREAIRRPI